MNFLRCKNTNLIFLFRILSNAIYVYNVLTNLNQIIQRYSGTADINLISFENKL